ncbi:MAG TPA: hypothetical protein VGK33_10320, partial [Chloroflexota bacterium]
MGPLAPGARPDAEANGTGTPDVEELMTRPAETASTPQVAVIDCPERQAAAARLGAERRRLWVITTVVSLAALLVPYLTGAWETLYFSLAATLWPLPVRAAIFLVGMHLALAVVVLPLSYYGGYVIPRAYGLGRQSRAAWSVDWLKGTGLSAVLGSAVGGLFLWIASVSGPNWWWIFGL